MALDPQQLRDDLEAFIAKNQATSEKHAATLAASATVSSTLVTEQANIDAATAHYEIEVGAARAELETATTDETAAKADEQAALQKLLDDAAAFEAG